MQQKKRVLLAMSGGVDSSAAALLLQQQGYEVFGITMKLWRFAQPDKCLNENDIEKAQHLADTLNIPLQIVDIKNDFKENVIDYFVDAYARGITPNPCTMCNPTIKWGALWKYFDTHFFDYYATGHYARINHQNGRYFVTKAKDLHKDQSYFLWRLSQAQLSKTLFPLGDFTKDEIRDYVANLGFNTVSKQRESQDVCFLENIDYRGFLKEQRPDIDTRIGPGNFVLSDGTVVGQHKGYYHYTIGQRKGLEIALGEPMYVIRIDVETNTVVLGRKTELETTQLLVDDIHLMKYDALNDGDSYQIRIRYRSKGVEGKIMSVNDKQLKIEFKENVSAVTPGQNAVFYEGDDVIGGGIILE